MHSRVAVIGAGYTGLVVALRLAEAGCNVTIFEKESSVGGLVGSFKIEGSLIEKSYHHIFKTDQDIINLINELGASDKLKWHKSSVAICYHGKVYPFVTAQDLIKFKPLSLINRFRAGLVVIYLQRTNRWHRFQHVSAYKWMRKTSGKQVTNVIWGPLLKGKFDKWYDKVSMAWLWARIHIRANSKDKDSKSELLGYFDGSFQVFTNIIMAKLKQLKVTVITGEEIKEIISQSNKKILINSTGGRQTYDICVSTVPSKIFTSLIGNNHAINNSYITKLNSVEYLGARLVVFSSKQKLSSYYWHNINDLSLPFLVFLNHTQLVGKEPYNNNYIYYMGAYIPHNHHLFTCSNNELDNIWFPALKTIFPKFNKQNIREKHHFRFANAQHIVDTKYETKIPSYKTPLKNIYLANFTQIYPEDRGTNYAVREGEKLARMILQKKSL
jgi:protoporphyrinogen oxidase